MTNKAQIHDDKMCVAEVIMSEDRDICALATGESEDQMTVAREVMSRRKLALKKLSE